MNSLNHQSAPHSTPLDPSTTTGATAGPEAVALKSANVCGFFEPGAYSVALKRCDNGHDLAHTLGDMFDERAQLEAAYATQLRAWSKKWHGELLKKQDYGTNKKLWDQTITTGEQMADSHATLSSSLSDSLVPKLRQWRKENYEKSLLHYKKTKEFEKEFIDAQKSWVDLLDKIAESKSAYYAACKAAKSVKDVEHNSSTANDDHHRKLTDKAEVARHEVDLTKTKYEQAVNEAGQQRPRYEKAMSEVFERTQAFEKKRLDIFKETFEEYHRILTTAVHDNTTFQKMIEYQTSLNEHNTKQDLTWWDQNYGTQTSSRWPEFEEYHD